MIPPDDESSSAGEPSGGSQYQTDTSRDADVHAFLIADVRGWTTFTQERGDEDAARLARRFAEVTRSVVEVHRGKVLELRGDEALVVFGSPRSAIRGAVALQQRFVEETIADPSLPLTVGIGLDAGEAGVDAPPAAPPPHVRAHRRWVRPPIALGSTPNRHWFSLG